MAKFWSLGTDDNRDRDELAKLVRMGAVADILTTAGCLITLFVFVGIPGLIILWALLF